MPRKNSKDKRRRTDSGRYEPRIERAKPINDFTIDALDYRNTELLRKFVTDQGKMLPRKYTGLPAPFQRRMSQSIKRARQMLLMK